MMRRALLTLEDVIAAPGESVEVRVQLERQYLLFVDPNLPREEVELHGESGLFGIARTDTEGIARWTFPGMPVGLHRLRARLPGRSRFHANQAEGLLAVWSPDGPALVTDIDHTIADVTPWGVLFRSNASIRPLPGAAEALRELAGRIRVVYLSARDHIFVAKTRDWLRANGFPEGPLFLRRIRFPSARALEHKIGRLGEVVARLKNVRYGIGDLPTDVEAYRRHGIPPIFLGRGPAPDGTPHAASWGTLKEMIEP